jgi:sugar phosphate isomerase/epimerase
MGIATTSFMTSRRPKDALQFLEYCHSLGAGGIQAGLPADLESARQLRTRAEELGMYVEAMSGLPRQDLRAFERAIAAAREAGALCVRSVCLGGRRYETFQDLAGWKKFVADSKAALARALPVLEKHRMAMALENHKDWTLDEMLALLREFSHERLGVCLDTGNNIALLDDPMDLTAQLAPYAVSTHIKDMAVEEYPDGFLLSEVPLGQGMLDLKGTIERIRKARPAAKFSLEMITRNPLRVPCLTEKYWVTFPERSGRHLARTMAMVRSRRGADPLPGVDGLSPQDQSRVEEDNVKQCLDYAGRQLGI